MAYLGALEMSIIISAVQIYIFIVSSSFVASV